MVATSRRAAPVWVRLFAGVLGLASCRGASETDLERGNRLFEQRNYREAVVAYEAASRQDPGRTMALRQLGLSYVALGERSLAINYLESAGARAPADTTIKLALGQLYLGDGRDDDAIKVANAVLDHAPQSLGALNIVGSAYLAKHDPGKAVEAYRKIAELAPNDAKAAFLVGEGLVAQGKSAEAIAQFESALTLSPVFYEALSKIVAVDAGSGHANAAVERVKKQIATVGDSVALKELLAVAYIAHGERDAGEVALQDVIRRAPSYLSPRIRLSELYRDWGKYDKALSVLDDASKVDPKNADVLLVKGVTYEAKGDRGNARKAYDQALVVNPGFAAAGNNLATLLAESPAELDRALKVITAASAADPTNPAIGDTFGWILFKRGDYPKAITILKDVAIRLPDEPTVAYHLGIAESKAGDMASARRDLQRAVSSPANFPEKQDAKKALAALP